MDQPAEPYPHVRNEYWVNFLLKRWSFSKPADGINRITWWTWVSGKATPSLRRLPEITRKVLRVPDAEVIEELGWSQIRFSPRTKTGKVIGAILQRENGNDATESVRPLTLENVIEWASYAKRKAAYDMRKVAAMLKEEETLRAEDALARSRGLASFRELPEHIARKAAEQEAQNAKHSAWNAYKAKRSKFKELVRIIVDASAGDYDYPEGTRSVDTLDPVPDDHVKILSSVKGRIVYTSVPGLLAPNVKFTQLQLDAAQERQDSL